MPLRIIHLLIFVFIFHFDVYGHEQFQVRKRIQKNHSAIVYLKDKKTGEKWVLKQVKNPTPLYQLKNLIETLGGEIAEGLGININFVRLIPPDEMQDLKTYPHLCATLHTFAYGKTTKKTKLWKNLNISQEVREPGTLKYNVLGPLKATKTGLSWFVVQDMARHPNLPGIVALDTYLGNPDRLHYNLFYQKKTNQFTGIDMGESYSFNLSRIAKEHFMEFMQSRNQVSKRVFDALVSYHDYFFALTEAWPEERISERLLELLEISEIVLDDTAEAQIQRYLKLIEESTRESQPLLEALQNLILERQKNFKSN